MQRKQLLFAVKTAILVGATTDVFMVGIYSLMTGEYWRMNVFALLRLNLFFPGIVEGTGWFIASYVCFFVLILLIGYVSYLQNKRK
ncbi:MAG: hypothetical protein NUV98_03315 [Candidatus Roizmanbacteria bacterium]|nr:hypothetical protein [Candidatus Roizmanbacteria bacterium]